MYISGDLGTYLWTASLGMNIGKHEDRSMTLEGEVRVSVRVSVNVNEDKHDFGSRGYLYGGFFLFMIFFI